MLITLSFSILNTISSKALSFLLQSLNGTNKSTTFETQKLLVFSKIVSLNLLDSPQVVILIVIIIKELD